MGRPAIWLVVLLLGWTATTALWIQREAAPPLWDQADYLQRSEVIAAHLRAGELGLLLDVLLHTGARSSFVALLPQAFYALLGHSPRTALLVNLVAMPVLLGSVYAMARHLLGPAAGILAAFFTAMSPLVFGLSRQFLTDFPLATAVALSYALLFASAYLTRSGWTWCLGVVLAAGLLLKVTFPLFVAGGLGLVVAIRLLAGPASRQLLPLDLFRLTLPVLVVAGPWYIVNLRGILWFSEYAAFGSAAQYYGLGPVLAPSTIWRYSGMLGLQAFSPLLVLLGVALVAAAALGGAWRYLLRRLRAPEPLAVALWGGLPLLALTLSYNKDMRYLLPAIPAFAVGLAALVQAQPRWVGGALLSLLTSVPAAVVCPERGPGPLPAPGCHAPAGPQPLHAASSPGGLAGRAGGGDCRRTGANAWSRRRAAREPWGAPPQPAQLCGLAAGVSPPLVLCVQSPFAHLLAAGVSDGHRQRRPGPRQDRGCRPRLRHALLARDPPPPRSGEPPVSPPAADDPAPGRK
ncbi:MAG: glycosyltransferase family 39 protein [Deltaproteobacteria bacterium]|nr:glycosyltransferase family 39 protein [Deltaproteobacteria bacterium]